MQSQIYFELSPSRGHALVCSILWTTFPDRGGLCDGGEEYKCDWPGATIAGVAWSVEDFVDDILENMMRLFTEPGLRLCFYVTDCMLTATAV